MAYLYCLHEQYCCVENLCTTYVGNVYPACCCPGETVTFKVVTMLMHA